MSVYLIRCIRLLTKMRIFLAFLPFPGQFGPTMSTTRFAPSPTGYLHLGHAYAALFAARAGAHFLVRMEDIDTTRCRAEYAPAIEADLRWLGLSFAPPLYQSTRTVAYRAALDRLSDMGLVYPCFCTRADIAAAAGAPQGPEGRIYPGTCRHMSEAEREDKIAAGVPYALRLDVAKAVHLAGDLYFTETGAGPDGETGRIKADPAHFGDIVLARKDAASAYHLAATVDDAYQGVDLVTRGEDLFIASHIQRLLQALLGLPEPVYRHHKLILDENGKKFSKRDHSVTLQSLRAAGKTPDDVLRMVGL